MSRHGIVLEVKGDICTVMDHDGIIRKIHKDAAINIGEEVTIKSTPEKFLSNTPSLLAAMFILFVISGSCFWFLNKSASSFGDTDPGTITVTNPPVPFAAPGANPITVPTGNSNILLYIGMAIATALFITLGGVLIYRGIKKIKKHQI